MLAVSAPTRALTHPIPLAGAALVLLNDFALRGTAPAWLTGKLSDVGWLVLVPVGLAAGFSAIGIGERRAQAGGLAIALTTYTTLQLWPPLGAWFSASHVADAGDLVALPALLLALLVWRTSRWNTRLPATVGAAAVAATLVADSWVDPPDHAFPCSESSEREAKTPLRFSLSDIDIPSDTDAFLRAISLVDEAGEQVLFLVIEEDGVDFALCARDGLRADTAYTWTLGPWDEASSNELVFSHAGFPPIEFLTGEDDGEPVADADACARLAEARPTPDDVVTTCDEAHSDTGW